MTRLIVTADDVGLHRGMTLGAIRAHRDGIVTACSLVANGRDFDHAVDVLRGCPGLDVGVHLTLVEERPVSPPASVPSLVTPRGTFVRDYRRFAVRHALGRISAREVEIELRAQIERILRTGLTPCHLNSHQHLHALSGIFEIVVRLARDYGIGYIRIPHDRVPPGTRLRRRAALAVLNHLGRRIRRMSGSFVMNDYSIGVAEAGHLDTHRLRRLLSCASGVTELVTHPGLDTAQIARSYDWQYDWDVETAALCDPTIREALAREEVALSGIRTLTAPAPSSPHGPTQVGSGPGTSSIGTGSRPAH